MQQAEKLKTPPLPYLLNGESKITKLIFNRSVIVDKYPCEDTVFETKKFKSLKV